MLSAVATLTGKNTIATQIPYLYDVLFLRSGFEGPWTFSPVTFSNEYFKLLFNETCVFPTIRPSVYR